MTTKRGAKTAMGRPSDDTTDRAQGFVKVALQIPDQTLGHVLCSALEGGSGYWCQIVGHRKPKTLAFRTHGEQVFPHIDYPMNAGGAVYLRELADKPEVATLTEQATGRTFSVTPETDWRDVERWLKGE